MEGDEMGREEEEEDETYQSETSEVRLSSEIPPSGLKSSRTLRLLLHNIFIVKCP